MPTPAASAIDALRADLVGELFVRGGPPHSDHDPAALIAPQNTLVRHDPDLIVAPADESDIERTVSFAADHGLPVRVQATGHGAVVPVTSGVLVTTVGLAGARIDPDRRVASIDAGVRWSTVLAAAADHGLAPVTGSSAHVGAVGYTLGGGLGPLARSHGYTTDWVRGFRVVLADGSVDVGPDQEPDLYWALRGGKCGLGLVTRVDVELAPLTQVYGGSLVVDGAHTEKLIRTWVDWAAAAPDAVTTSVAILNLPDFEFIPEPLRGRTVAALRFAHPGPAADGERLVAPLRACAPALFDTIGPMPAAAVAMIHNEPDAPGPMWSRGTALLDADQTFAGAFLGAFGPGADSPFLAAEIRHLGGATRTDVDGGSAAGGRDAGFQAGLVGADPRRIDEMAERAAAFSSWSIPWAAPETNINLLGGPWTDQNLARAWSPETAARLDAVRSAYDPTGVFAFRVDAAPDA